MIEVVHFYFERKIIEEMKTTFQSNFPFEIKLPLVSASEIHPIFLEDKNKLISKLEQRKIKIINQDQQISINSEKICTFAHGDIFPGKWNGKPVTLRKYAYLQITEDLEKTLLKEFAKLPNMKFPRFNNFYGVYLEKESGFLYSVHEFAQGSLLEKLKTKLSFNEKNSIIIQIIDLLAFHSKRLIFHEKIELKNFLIAENGQLQGCDLGFNNNNASESKIEEKNENFNESEIGEKNVNFNEAWFLGLMMYEIYMEETLWNESQIKEIVKKWKEQNSEPEIKKYEGENAKNINKIIRGCLKLKNSERMNIEDLTKIFKKKILKE